MTPSKPRKLTIPESRWKDIRELLLLSADRLKQIGEVLNSKESLKDEVPSFVAVARATGLANHQAYQVIGAMQNLALQRKQFEISDDELLSDLRAGFDDPPELNAAQEAALLNLLGESDQAYLVEKAESLKHGLVPHMISARTICDLRPVFDRKREQLEGALLVTYLDIKAHDGEEEYRKLLLQLSETDLKELATVLADAIRKVELLKTRFGRDVELFT